MRDFGRRLMSIVGFGFAFFGGMNVVHADEMRALILSDSEVQTNEGASVVASAKETRPMLFEGRVRMSGSSERYARVERTGAREQSERDIHLVVERVEEDEVVLETRAGLVRFPREALPAGADHEGAVIRINHASSEENRRISAAHARIKRMQLLSMRYAEGR